ncbi:MAG: tetratricopeptide repeat protein [Rhodocyclales bacterium]|nr:tetratricopeptide repeat protein [Rhodocyclales bacterium]
MSEFMTIHAIRRSAAIVLFLILGGCAGQMAHRDGVQLLAEGRAEEGIAALERATTEAPDNIEFRLRLTAARESTATRLIGDAQRERGAGRLDEAETIYRRAIKIDPGNKAAVVGLTSLEQARRLSTLLKEANAQFDAGNIDAAELRLNRVQQENPQLADARSLRRKIDDKLGRNQALPSTLRNTFKKPVTLEFRDANLKQVIEVLARHSGLNFILDKEVAPNLPTTVFLRQVTVEDALDVLLTTHQLDRRVMNDTTLLIYPNTAAKQTAHQELVVKSFFLSNADAKQTANMLKTVLKAKNVFVDDKLNLVILRDTPTMIRLAERLVATQDISEPEVMLDVEVIEVQRSRLLELGIQFPNQLSLVPLPSTGTVLTLRDLNTSNSSRTGATITPLVLNLRREVGDTNILANPRVRTHSREKAQIKIGDRVPVITTTSTSTGFVSESVQYVDVGLKLDVEPTVYPDDEISIKVALEVSSVVKEVTSKAGSLSYQIGARNASTVLRLKDGETQILGGLINDTERNSAQRVPGLGDLPVIGRLFSSQKDDNQKTELVLSITPRLVRGLVPPTHVPTEFWSGTENNPMLKPIAAYAATPTGSGPAPTLTLPAASPAGATGTAPADASESGVSAAAPILRWEGSPATKVGGVFKLKLSVSAAEAISALPIQVKYDPTVLEAVDARAGAFLSQAGKKVEFTKRIVGAAGMIFVTQNVAGEGIRGDGELVELEFRALKPLPSSLVTALPTMAVGSSGRPSRQTAAALIGVTVTP